MFGLRIFQGPVGCTVVPVMRPAIDVFPERYEAFLNPFERVYLAERDKRRQAEKERDFGLSDLRP